MHFSHSCSVGSASHLLQSNACSRGEFFQAWLRNADTQHFCTLCSPSETYWHFLLLFLMVLLVLLDESPIHQATTGLSSSSLISSFMFFHLLSTLCLLFCLTSLSGLLLCFSLSGSFHLLIKKFFSMSNSRLFKPSSFPPSSFVWSFY